MVVHDVTLQVAPRECLALVGESGSGKTTLARSVAGLHSDRIGEIMLNGVPLANSARDRPREQRRTIQYVFQNPSVLVCDEVTSALDVSVQAAIVELLGTLQRDLGLAKLFVTHNLPLVRSIAQRVAVMNQGRIIELGAVDQVLGSPQDSYTRRLLSDTPSLEVALETAQSS